MFIILKNLKKIKALISSL